MGGRERLRKQPRPLSLAELSSRVSGRKEVEFVGELDGAKCILMCDSTKMGVDAILGYPDDRGGSHYVFYKIMTEHDFKNRPVIIPEIPKSINHILAENGAKRDLLEFLNSGPQERIQQRV